jgi:hypothetical protein
VWGRRETQIEFWRGNLKEGEHFGNLGVYGRIILQYILKEWNETVWNELIWVRIGTYGRLL